MTKFSLTDEQEFSEEHQKVKNTTQKKLYSLFNWYVPMERTHLSKQLLLKIFERVGVFYFKLPWEERLNRLSNILIFFKCCIFRVLDGWRRCSWWCDWCSKGRISGGDFWMFFLKMFHLWTIIFLGMPCEDGEIRWWWWIKARRRGTRLRLGLSWQSVQYPIQVKIQVLRHK